MPRVWALITEPWYSDALILQMSQGPNPAPWRDETRQVGGLFPWGMPRIEAMNYLARNGFSCLDDRTQGGRNEMMCAREKTSLVCRTSYTVHLAFAGESVADVKKAGSYMACL
jgi:hypothetical protein